MSRLISKLGCMCVCAPLAVAGCTSSSEYDVPGPRPLIVKASVADDVNCAPKDTGGACPISVSVTFRLPENQSVTSAFVRFQRDGSDEGVDRQYVLNGSAPGLGGGIPGRGDGTDASVGIDAFVPPNLVGTGSLFRFSVRLVTALGEESDPSTLTVTVKNQPKIDSAKK